MAPKSSVASPCVKVYLNCISFSSGIYGIEKSAFSSIRLGLNVIPTDDINFRLDNIKFC